VVRPSGVLVVAAPAYQSLWSDHDVVNHHRRRYNRKTLSAVASAAGCTLIWSSYFNACLLPIAAGHRRLERLRPAVDEPTSDLDRTPRYLNTLLELPLRCEASLIAHGGQIPAGLSLIAALKNTIAAGSSSEDSAPGRSRRREHLLRHHGR
jgi:hypothetical protein